MHFSSLSFLLYFTALSSPTSQSPHCYSKGTYPGQTLTLKQTYCCCLFFNLPFTITKAETNPTKQTNNNNNKTPCFLGWWGNFSNTVWGWHTIGLRNTSEGFVFTKQHIILNALKYRTYLFVHLHIVWFKGKRHIKVRAKSSESKMDYFATKKDPIYFNQC